MNISIDGNIVRNTAQIVTTPGPVIGILGCILLIVVFMKVAQWGDSRKGNKSAGNQINTPFGMINVSNGQQPQRSGASGGWLVFMIIVVIGLIMLGAVGGTLPS